MIRNLGGIAAGIAIAIAIMVIAEAIGHALFARGLGPYGGSPPTMALPDEVNLSVLIGWFLAALLGGYASVWISRVDSTAWAIAAVILLAVALRFALAAAPTWMIVGGVLAPPAGGWLAQKLPRRPARAAP